MDIYLIGRKTYRYSPNGDLEGEGMPEMAMPIKAFFSEKNAEKAIIERYGQKRITEFSVIKVEMEKPMS